MAMPGGRWRREPVAPCVRVFGGALWNNSPVDCGKVPALTLRNWPVDARDGSDYALGIYIMRALLRCTAIFLSSRT